MDDRAPFGAVSERIATRRRSFDPPRQWRPGSVLAAKRARGLRRGQFSGRVSAERIDDFAVADIVVTYRTGALRTAMAQNPLASRMAAGEAGSVVLLGNDALGTADNSTPLSIGWLLEDYVALLSDAERKAQ